MRYYKLRPMLWAGNLDETIHFYTNALGFTCNNRNDDLGWASLGRDGVEVMLSKPNEHMPFTGCTFTGSFYIDTDDVDAAWDMVKDKAKICYEPESFEWGMREFAVYDNNGYIIQFGQDLGNMNDQ